MLNMKTDGLPEEVLHEVDTESKKRLMTDPLYNDLVAAKLKAIEQFETETKIMLTVCSLQNADTNEMQRCLDNMTNIVSSYGQICYTLGNWEGKMQMNVLSQLESENDE